MDSALREKIESVNAQLAGLLEDTRRALRGARDFGVEQVRALSRPISEMAPVMERAAELRTLHPEIQGQLDLYKSQLGELHILLQHGHMMLQARRGQREAGRVQMEAVSQWAKMLGQTR